jgi:hypothetical protein
VPRPDEQIPCAHCDGTGICRGNAGETSCDECAAVALARVDSKARIKLASCSKCDGTGRRSPAAESWERQQQETLGRHPPPAQFAVEQEEVTARLLNRGRLIVSLSGAVLGGLVIAGGIALELKYPDREFLTALLPVGSALASGGLGAYIGGGRGTSRSIDGKPPLEGAPLPSVAWPRQP